MGSKYKGYKTIEEYWEKNGYWDDLRFPMASVRKVTGKEPIETAYKGGLVYAFSTSSDNSVAFNAQMPHGYNSDLDVEFHIHYALPVSGAGGGAENIKFDLTYSWADLDGLLPAETTLSATNDAQNEVADTHTLFSLGDLLITNRGAGTPVGGTSSMIICSLTRDVSVANDYANVVYLLEADFHYRFDAPGSREIIIK